MSVRKPDAFAKFEGERTPIRGHLPGLRQPRLCLLRSSVNADQIGVEPADYLARDRIGRSDGIQSFGFGALPDN
jgi:hypothetical protein